MAKTFNTTAVCIPEKHYMVNIDKRLKEIKSLIDAESYFTVNRARQYGKTTTLMALEQYLAKDYYVVFMDFQMFDASLFENGNVFALSFARVFLRTLKSSMMRSSAKLTDTGHGSPAGEHLSEMQGGAGRAQNHDAGQLIEKLKSFIVQQAPCFTMQMLFEYLSDLCAVSDKPIVLIIDEVDSASDNQVFLDFLAQLRAYYIKRAVLPTFRSVILAGVYDVKNLKSRLRTEENYKVNSPWNIAVPFNVEMSFSKDEIAGMLHEYEADYRTGMDIDEIAGLLYDDTSGYPFLVSRLCQLMDTEVREAMGSRAAAWTLNGFMEADRILTSEKNTLFESMIGKVINYPRLNSILQNKIFRGETVSYNASVQEIDLAEMFGIVKNDGGIVVPANKVIAKVLADYYLSQDEIRGFDCSMNIYVNPGNASFRRARNSDIYIDKTGLIAAANHRIGKTNCYMCVSRPRRFGKSMAADMLAAYYSKGCDSAGLFEGMKAEQEETFRVHLNRHNVIRLDIQRFLESEKDVNTFMDEIERRVIAELMEGFPECKGISPDDRLKVVLDVIFNQTGNGFIFIIDEWDCVFRIAREREDIQKGYLDFLRGLFKGSDYVELAYMTGILPVKKYGDHSAINIFREFSMLSPKGLAEYFGFTEGEVEALCAKYHVDYPKTRKWYDGYRLGNLHIYNPQAVIELMESGRFGSYWTGTETYEALKIYIDRDFDGLKQAVIEMLGNVHCKIDSSTSQNDMTTFKTKDDILTLLVHLGYLAFDEAKEEVFIPNQEITQEFMRAVKVGGWEGLMEALDCSERLLHSTWEMDGEAVAAGVETIHNKTASLLKYNNENSLTCTILIAYYSSRIYYMDPVMELPSGKGLADVVYLPRRDADCPALVIELKWSRSAQGAIDQIKRKQYASWIEGYTGDILLVGINYHAKTKKHECVIEKYVKE